MSFLLRILVLGAPLMVGCGSSWTVVDNDNDGFSLADGDCWDSLEGPPGSSLSGSDIYPGASDAPYDGFDADCAGDDDYDRDGDGYVTDPAHVGLETFAVAGTGQSTAAGDCWDDPTVVPEGFDAINGFDALVAADVYPGAADIPYDAVDSACDGGDEFDADGDGYATSSYADRDGNTGDDCFDLDESGYGDFDPYDVNPGAPEVCGDEVDTDCDDLIDAEDEDAEAVTWFVDADGDEYGDIDANDKDGTAVVACEAPKGFVLDQTDCDDDEATTFPGADEYCDNVDNDCNGIDDDDDAIDASVWFVDNDGDGFGDATKTTTTCYQPSGYVALDTDCDDTSVRTYPGAAVADSFTDCMRDDDEDGYGDASPPSGVTIGTDCNDADNTIFPGATEGVGDNVDQDCDTNEECYIDADDDGYRLTSTVTSSDADCLDSGEAEATDPTGECDDTSATTYPGAAFNESSTSCRKDDDGDGYGDDNAPSGVTDGDDCNDGDSAISPAATEIAGDEVDQDCDTNEECYVDADDDGYRLTSTVNSRDIDCTDSGEAVSSDPTGECDDTSDTTYPGAAFNESSTSCRKDDDGDGYGDDNAPSGVTDGDDCNDDDSAVNPAATELAGDNIDQDCDTTEECYIDADDDGYRLTSTVTSSDIDCTASGEAEASDPTGDCDDGSNTTFPGAAPNDSSSACMRDDDGDDFGDTSAPSGGAAGTDCDDGDSAINPDATEIAGDEVDQDCNTREECFDDADDDGYRLTSTSTSSDLDCTDSGEALASDPTGECDDSSATTYPGAAFNESSTSCRKDDDGDGYGDDDAPSGVTDGRDCNDADSAINPVATEIAGDEVDQDCNNIEDCYVDADDDGYRLTSTVTSSDIDCTDSGEAVSSDPTGDCDDGSNTTFPGAASKDSSSACMRDDDGDDFGDTSAPSGGAAGTDCDDGDSAINPDATEIAGDEVDQDCNTREECFDDADDDGYRLTSTSTSSDLDCTDSGEALASDPTGDCDDSSNTTFPGAAPKDSSSACMRDDDGDDFGDDTVSGSIVAGDDCDDGDSSVNPDATEIVGDNFDQDCNNTEECYVDSDNDGYRLTATTTSSDADCLDSGEAVSSDPTGDCDDSSNTTFPGAAPNDSASACMRDDDGDDYGDTSAPSGGSAGTDCDDDDNTISPAATEIAGDNVDQDCNDSEECYVDSDNDGYRLTSTFASSDTDCNDSGEALSSDPTGDCDDTSDTTYPGAAFNESASQCMRDDDGDGYGDTSAPSSGSAGTDCDDSVDVKYPGAPEVCNDGVADNDCDLDDEECTLSDTDFSTAPYIFEGVAGDDRAGLSVQVGDLSGDGVDDVFVGAWGADSAYMITGPISAGTMVLSDSDATLTGDSNTGYSISTVGDVDGDGFGDMMVGAPAAGSSNNGEAYLLLGPVLSDVDMETSADGRLYSTNSSAYVGLATAMVQDIMDTNDGDWDAIVGAPGEKDGSDRPGAVYIHMGLASYSTTDVNLRTDASVLMLTGEDDGDYAGAALAGLTDVNGDGISDFVAGAYKHSSDAGRAYLFYGPVTLSGGLENADMVLDGSSSSDELGFSVSSAGDANDDGYTDVLIGAPGADEAYLFYGPVSAGTLTPASADVTFSGDSSGDEFGIAVSGGGDIELDGDNDVLISAQQSSTGGGSAGSVYLFYGPFSATSLTASDAAVELYGGAAGDQAGRSVVGGVDVNTDGYSDFMVGAHSADPNGSKSGEAYLILGTVE